MIILALGGAVGLRKTNVLAMIPGMDEIILATSSASRETNILVVILDMHGIIHVFCSTVDSKRPTSLS